MECVLIVDDSTEQLERHKQFLEDSYHILCCKSGTEAMDMLRAEAVDLILLDIEMPLMDGYEVLRQIRELNKGMNLAVVGLTGNKSRASVLKFISKGGTDYLIKPVTPEGLREKVAQVLLQERQNRERKKILIVDDELESLLLFKNLLKDSYHVTTLNAGKMAIDYLYKNKPDLILLDYHMAPFSGVSLFRMFRNMESAKDIPIAFITGCHDKDTIYECARLAPAGVFLKPVERGEFLGKIRGILG